MTNPSQRHEEKARELWLKLVNASGSEALPIIAAALASAEVEEREACAKIADDMTRALIERGIEAVAQSWPIEEITPDQVVNGYRMIARLIRTRGPTPRPEAVEQSDG